MSYLQTVNEIRTAAKAVNPHGTFDHGGHVDISQDFDKPLPFIYLYPMSDTPGVDPNFIDSNTILMGFWAQDDPASTTEEREKLIGRMDDLSKDFLLELMSNKLVKVFSISREPVYKFYNGTFSGYLVRFTYQNFSPCP
jgi:hypothetical protein